MKNDDEEDSGALQRLGTEINLQIELLSKLFSNKIHHRKNAQVKKDARGTLKNYQATSERGNMSHHCA